MASVYDHANLAVKSFRVCASDADEESVQLARVRGVDARFASWPLHTISAMSLAIRADFTLRSTHYVPYLYRYLIPELPQTEEAASIVAEAYRDEQRLGQAGKIPLIGRRIVADPPNR